MIPSEENRRDLKSILPKHHIGDELWDNIEHQLNPVNKLPEMPQYAARENLWEGILVQLNTSYKLQRRRSLLRVGAYVSGIAASLLLILYILNPFQNQQPITKTEVVHTEEIIQIEPPARFAMYESEKGADDIVEYCANFPNICVNPEFVQLQSKWQNLKEQLIQLKTLSNSGNNDKVDYYKARIEMDIKQLENKMMHMFL